MMVNQKHSVSELKYNSQSSVDYCSSQKRRKLSNDQDETAISSSIFCGDQNREPKDAIERAPDEDDEDDIELIDLNIDYSCHLSATRDESSHSSTSRHNCTNDLNSLSGEIIQGLPVQPIPDKIKDNVQDGGNIANMEIEGRRLRSHKLLNETSDVVYVEMVDPLLEASSKTLLQSTANDCLEGPACVTQIHCIVKQDPCVVVKLEDNYNDIITIKEVNSQLKTAKEQELALNANKIAHGKDCEKEAAFTRKGEKIIKDRNISSDEQLSCHAGKVSKDKVKTSHRKDCEKVADNFNVNITAKGELSSNANKTSHKKDCEKIAAFTRKGKQSKKDKNSISSISNQQLSCLAEKVSNEKDKTSYRKECGKVAAFTRKGEQIKKDKKSFSSNQQSSFHAGKISIDMDENSHRKDCEKEAVFTRKGEQKMKDKNSVPSNKQLSCRAGKISNTKDEASLIPSIPVFPRTRNIRRSRRDKMEDESGASERSRERSSSPEIIELEARSISVGMFTGYPIKPVTVSRDKINFHLKDDDDIYTTFDVKAKELKYCFTCFSTSNINYIFFLVHPSCSFKIKKCVKNGSEDKQSNTFIIKDNKGPSFSIITLVIEKIKQEMICQFEKYMNLYYKNWGKQNADMFYLGITHSEAAMIRALNKSEISQNTFRSSITDDVRTFLQLSRCKPISKSGEIFRRNKQGGCKLTDIDHTRRKKSPDVSVKDSSGCGTSLGITEKAVHTTTNLETERATGDPSKQISTLSNLNSGTQNEEIGAPTVVVKQEETAFDLASNNSVNQCSISALTLIKQEPCDTTLETNINPSAIFLVEKGKESSVPLKEESVVIYPSSSSSQLILDQSSSYDVQDVKTNQKSTLIPAFPVTPRKENRSRRDKMENKSGACQRSRERSSSPQGIVELEARSVSVGTFSGYPTEPVKMGRDGVNLVIQGDVKRFPLEFTAAEIQQCYAHYSISDFNYLFFLLSPQGRARIKRSLTKNAEEKRENTFINQDPGPSYSIITIVMEEIEQDVISKFEKLMELYKSHQKLESFYMKITHPEAAMIRALDKSESANNTFNSDIADDINVFLQLTHSKSH